MTQRLVLDTSGFPESMLPVHEHLHPDLALGSRMLTYAEMEDGAMVLIIRRHAERAADAAIVERMGEVARIKFQREAP